MKVKEFVKMIEKYPENEITITIDNESKSLYGIMIGDKSISIYTEEELKKSEKKGEEFIENFLNMIGG
jgi:hypothetical protein